MRSYGDVVGLSQSRQGLMTLNSNILAFGEDHRVDLLEEFVVQYLDGPERMLTPELIRAAKRHRR